MPAVDHSAQLRDPAHQVSPRARIMWTVSAIAQVTVAAAAQLVWWFVDRDGSRTAQVALAVVTAALALIYVAVMPAWRYRVHRWEATPTAVYTQTGWLTQERRIAPVSRIQTVDLQRGPLAQLFGLASVTVMTASMAGPLRIVGVDHEVACALVDSLTEATAQETGDAT